MPTLKRRMNTISFPIALPKHSTIRIHLAVPTVGMSGRDIRLGKSWEDMLFAILAMTSPSLKRRQNRKSVQQKP